MRCMTFITMLCSATHSVLSCETTASRQLHGCSSCTETARPLTQSCLAQVPMVDVGQLLRAKEPMCSLVDR